MAALAASSRYRLLQITFTTSHDPPRDTLNDEGTLLFFCLSHRSTKRLFFFYFVLVHDAESTHRTCTPMSPPRRAPEDLRRVARCELPSLANSHARVRGRVTFVAVAEFHGTPSSRQLGPEEKSALIVLLPSPGSSFVRSLRLHIFSQRRALSRRPLCRFSSS